MDSNIKYILPLNPPGICNGYSYLDLCIFLILEDEDRLFSLNKSLFPLVAKRYDVSEQSVEVSSRRAIQKIFDGGDKKLLERIMGARLESRPTVKEFLSQMVIYYQHEAAPVSILARLRSMEDRINCLENQVRLLTQ